MFLFRGNVLEAMDDHLNNTLTVHTLRPGDSAVERYMPHMQPGPRLAKYDALILDAGLRQSLVAIRSLGQQGKCVAALEVNDLVKRSKYIPAFTSRWCQRGYVAPSYKQDIQPFLFYLKQVLESAGARVLIPSSDGTLALLRAHRDEIEGLGTRVALAKEAALAAAVQKDTTLHVAERLGIKVPRGVMVGSVGEVREALRTIGLPAVVKPVESWQRGEGYGTRLLCALVTNEEEARRAVEEATQFGGSALFQQFLSGRREAVSFLYADGDIYARFAQWAKRTQPPLGGTSVYRQSIAVPEDSGAQAERLVRELELEGYAEVEFRRDSAGVPYLMEINPRLSASVEIAVRSGVDFPYLLYQWASGEKIERVGEYRSGGWMRYLEGDLLAAIQAIQQRGRPGIPPPPQVLSAFLLDFFVPACYDYVYWKDPLPAWTAIRDFTHRLRKKFIQ